MPSPLSAGRFHLAGVGPVVRLLYFLDGELDDRAGLVQLVPVWLEGQGAIVLVPHGLALRVGFGVAGQSNVFAFFDLQGLFSAQLGRNCAQ